MKSYVLVNESKNNTIHGNTKYRNIELTTQKFRWEHTKESDKLKPTAISHTKKTKSNSHLHRSVENGRQYGKQQQHQHTMFDISI